MASDFVPTMKIISCTNLGNADRICANIPARALFIVQPYAHQCQKQSGSGARAQIIELSKSYQSQFVERASSDENEENVDSSVIADFDAVYAKGIGIRPVLFSLRDMIGLAIPIALAFVPTLLTKMTLKELLGIVLGFVT